MESINRGGTYYLIHSGQTYDVAVDNIPAQCKQFSALVLIKLPSSTHGWENGQHFYNVPISRSGGKVRFTAPDAKTANLPPAYYMLFYVDCDGKPAASALMVRFDDQAKEPERREGLISARGSD